MPVVPVSGNHVVVFAEQRDRADGDSFLARVEMKKASHFSQVVILEGGLLEPPDPEHFTQETNFFLFR